MTYASMDKGQLQKEYELTKQVHGQNKAKNLKLDMSRGKPGRDQLDLSLDMMGNLVAPADYMADGVDTRNYGVMDGLPCCKKYFSQLLGVKEEQLFIGGNASLQLMYDTIAKAYTHGLPHSKAPWGKLDKVKFLCPSPGYDRHFNISVSFGMELITIPMTEFGPDMNAVEEAIKDESVKGMWCTPKYSNPAGIIYTDEVINRIAGMRPAAKDFLLMWDNAYCVHEFDGAFVPFAEILSLCEKQGNADMVFEYASTSKITLPGGGVSCMACSETNMAHMKKLITYQTISYDKVNQLRHTRFLKDKENTLLFMQKHAAILKPKFQAVLRALDKEIAPLSIASWNRPKGGYFISLDTMPGCAKRTWELCKEAGVVLTEAGATFPYGKDPEDKNIRIAPSFPPVPELQAAIEVFCTSLKLATLEKLLNIS